MAEEAEIVTLLDESGEEVEFRLHDVFDLDGATYYLVESLADPDQVLLLRETAGALESVEGDEFDRVVAALEEEPD